MSVRGDSMLRNGNISGSELKEKIELYSELTGQDGWNVPITKVADFISGFEMGREKFRRRGCWIHKEGAVGVAYCSECKYRLKMDETNFCPECGADMRGE